MKLPLASSPELPRYLGRATRKHRYHSIWNRVKAHARAETPCGDCMGSGCGACNQSGIDLDSWSTTRMMVANVLESMMNAPRSTLINIACALTNGKEPVEVEARP